VGGRSCFQFEAPFRAGVFHFGGRLLEVVGGCVSPNLGGAIGHIGGRGWVG
jgi:hypothetical protein